MKKPQNIPTWNYPSKGTPIYRNTSEVPPKFKYGGKMYDFGGNLGAGVSGVAQGIAGSLLPGPLGAAAVKGIQGIHGALDKNMSEQEKGIAGFGRSASAIGSAIATGGTSLATGADDIASGLATGIGGFNGNGDDQMLNTVGQAAGFVGGGITEGAGSEGGMLGAKGFVNKYNPNSSQYKDWTTMKTGLDKDWRNTMKYGGNIYPMGGQMQQGMENQLTEFNEGGTHEMNPQGGIPQGMGANGQPNLVEEGETKLNSKDYVYSDSLKLDKMAVESFNLPSKFVNKTFAEVSKLVDRPNSRRENDTIENEAKTRELDSLMNAQEDFKAREFEAKMQEAQTMFPEQFATMQGMFAGQGQPQQQEQGMEDPNAINDPMGQDPNAQAMGNPIEQQMGIGQEQMMKYGGNLFAGGGGITEGEPDVRQLIANLRKQYDNGQITAQAFEESVQSLRTYEQNKEKNSNINNVVKNNVSGITPNIINNNPVIANPIVDNITSTNTTNTPFEVYNNPNVPDSQEFQLSQKERDDLQMVYDNGDVDQYDIEEATTTNEEVIAGEELTDDQAEEMGLVKNANGDWVKINDYKELPTSKFEQTKLNAAASLAPVAFNAGMGIKTMFEKPMKLSYEDYMNNASITAPKMNIDPQLRAAEQEYAAGQKGIKNIGGAAYLRTIGSLANQGASTRAGLYANKENVDNQAKLQADMFNSQLQGQNNQQRFQIDDWNARAKTAKAQQTADYLGAATNQVGQLAQTDTGNKLGLMYAKMGNEDVAGKLQFNTYMDQWMKSRNIDKTKI